MNPFDGIATFILGKIKEGIWAQWLRFLFEMGFSGIVSFLFIAGTTLITSHSWTIGIGSGMLASAVCMTALFRREASKLTRGMLVVLPGGEAAKEIEASLQAIQKPEK